MSTVLDTTEQLNESFYKLRAGDIVEVVTKNNNREDIRLFFISEVDFTGSYHGLSGVFEENLNNSPNQWLRKSDLLRIRFIANKSNPAHYEIRQLVLERNDLKRKIRSHNHKISQHLIIPIAE